jgi:hypothetical protein
VDGQLVFGWVGGEVHDVCSLVSLLFLGVGGTVEDGCVVVFSTFVFQALRSCLQVIPMMMVVGEFGVDNL